MSRFLLFVLTLAIASCFTPLIKAEALAPTLVVKLFIEAVQKKKMANFQDDLENIAKQKEPHNYAVKELRRLFAKVNTMEFDYSKLGSSYDKKTNIVTMRMDEPIKVEFFLQHQNSVFRKTPPEEREKFRGKGDYYQIMGMMVVK